MEIAFFDFDGTITKGDSFGKFLHFTLGSRFYIKVLKNLHILILYKLGIINNATTKQKILKSCLGNMKYETLMQKCYEFSNFLESYCKKSAMEKIKWHKENSHIVVIVSASFEEYLKPFWERREISVLATSMEVQNGVITGNFANENCYGKEKVRRIKLNYDLSKFKKIYVYGDTRGDFDMLKLASENCGFYRVFE